MLSKFKSNQEQKGSSHNLAQKESSSKTLIDLFTAHIGLSWIYTFRTGWNEDLTCKHGEEKEYEVYSGSSGSPGLSPPYSWWTEMSWFPRLGGASRHGQRGHLWTHLCPRLARPFHLTPLSPAPPACGGSDIFWCFLKHLFNAKIGMFSGHFPGPFKEVAVLLDMHMVSRHSQNKHNISSSESVHTLLWSTSFSCCLKRKPVLSFQPALLRGDVRAVSTCTQL